MARKYTKLTRAKIRKLDLGKKITESGITVERIRNGDLRYSVAISVDGDRIHRVIGLESERVTRTQCEDFIAKVKLEARENRLALPKGRKLHPTFSQAADIYLQKLAATDGKNIKEKSWHIRLHLKPYFKDARLEDISVLKLEEFQRKCRKGGLSDSTIIQLLSTYRHMGRKLAEWEIISFVPMMNKLPKPDNSRDYVLSHAEKDALLGHAMQDDNPHVWLFISIALHTSLRHSEILSARFDGFDEDRQRLTVRVKGGDLRKQPLTKYITRVISEERLLAADHDGWIFPNPASISGHYDSMKSPFKRVVVRAGLDPRKVTPHVLRHTAITDFAETGAPVQTIKEFSGHKSIDMVMRYVHARESAVNDALDVFENSGTNSVPINIKDSKCS